MNWLKKGPELKIPKLRKPRSDGANGKGSGLKPPAFLVDLYNDLRDRRLLLPIALVLVAIAAVPFLLGGSQPEIPSAPVVGSAAVEPQAASASLAVVEAKPGLRDYRKRLGDRTATNPFKQRYTSLPDSAKVESTTTSSTSSSSGGSGGGSIESEEASEETVTSPGGSGSTGGEGSSQAFELVINVQITRTEVKPDGSEERGETEVRKNVPVLTQLPGRKTPVITTMGANFKTERLVFLVSHDVKSISGEYGCITRADVCELLEVGLGALLEFVYEPSGAHYEVKVTGVDAIPVRKGRSSRSSRVAFSEAYPGMSWKNP